MAKRPFSIHIFLIVLFIGIWYSVLSAQDNTVKFNRISEGLSQSWVISMVQDHRGFMWFGTQNGLNRYDGTQFIIYESNKSDSTTLSDNRVNFLFVDSKDNLWISSANKLNLYRKEFDDFLVFKNDPNDPTSISSDSPGEIVEDQEGYIWIATPNGVDKYDPNRKVFIKYGNTEGLSDININALGIDHEQKIWAGTMTGFLYYFDQNRDKFIPYDVYNDRRDQFNVNRINAISVDKDGSLWLATYGGGLISIQRNGKIIQYKNKSNDLTSLAYNEILSLCVEENGNIWIGTENYGLDYFDRKSNKFIHYIYNPNDRSSISSNSIHSIYKDTEDRLWVGTFHTGLNVVDKYHEKFNYYRNVPSQINSLSNNSVTCFVEDRKGNLWIGTDGGGINYFDRKYKTFSHYSYNPQDKNGLSSNAVLALYLDNNENLWIGTWAGGLNVLNTKTNQIRYYTTENSALSNNNIFSLLSDGKDTIYIATGGGGLNILDKKSGNISVYRANTDDMNGLLNDFLLTLYRDKKGDIWIATLGAGLSLIQPQDDGTLHFKSFSNRPGGLSGNTIDVMHEDRNNNFWVGTNNDGLNLLDRESGNCRVFKKEDGLPSNSISGILEDSKGNLWISTGRGICRFNPETKKFRKYRLRDGLQGNEYSRNAANITDDGYMLFGGKNGFNIFNPDQIKDNPNIPPVYLTNFKIFNKTVPIGKKRSPLEKHISQTEKIVLNYKQSSFSFEYIAINFSQGENNQYKYMLEGFDSEWTHAGSNRTASYTNLNPGDYTFRVAAANNDEIWNDSGASIQIIIQPPFWARWWFRTLAILIIVGSAYLWYYLRMARLRRQKEELERQVKERTKDFHAAKKETDDILQNVDEGLFLLDNKYSLGTQHSAFMEELFEQKGLQNINFLDLLKNKIEDEHIVSTRRYLDLMFKNDVDEEMLDMLNPLVEIKMKFNSKIKKVKYLAFKFRRIYDDKKNILELITTAKDITEQVLLAQDLKEAEEQTDRQMNWLLSILHVEPQMLNEFIDSVQKELDLIETLLSSEHEEYKSVLEQIYRSMHMIKGNASLLALNFFADEVHRIEDQISELQKHSAEIPGKMSELSDSVNKVRMMLGEVHNLLNRIGDIHNKIRPKRSYEEELLIQSLSNLINQSGEELGKKITLDSSEFKGTDVPSYHRLLVKEILIQLARNSIAHGIETPKNRKKLNKTESGNIKIRTNLQKDKFIFSLRDDGCGIHIPKLRNRLLESGKVTKQELNVWGEQKIAESIFMSGISTADNVNMISGRGVGMDLVKEKIDKNNGTIVLDYTEDEFCEFTVTLPLVKKN
jgi:ligand-binding sensor domain-containing protein/signal transduction histidine kinase